MEKSLMDSYELLGLPQSASLPQVKEAYKRLALLNHPDKGGTSAIMQLINKAYRNITNEAGQYDTIPLAENSNSSIFTLIVIGQQAKQFKILVEKSITIA